MSPPLSRFEEPEENKLTRKIKENPFFPIALTAFTGIVAYGLYGLKYRKMPLSLYLIHLRVASQGTAVGILGIGMTFMLGKRVYNKVIGKNESGIESSGPHST